MVPEAEKQLVEAFVEALNTVPQAQAELRADDEGLRLPRDVDALVRARIGGRDLLIVVEAKQTAFPRDVREALWRLRNQIAHGQPDLEGEILTFIIANTLSPGAREELRQAGAGYFDMSGSLYVPAENAFIFVDRPPPKGQAKALTTIFHGRKAAVLRMLFKRRHEWVNVKEVADAAEVSPATTSETLTELERRDWVETRGAGPAKQRRLVKVAEMLDAWARDVAARSAPRYRRFFVPMADAEKIVRNLAQCSRDTGGLYAITGEAAGQVYTPYLSHVSQVRCRLKADPKGQSLLEGMNARPVSEGWNLSVLETRDPSDFSDVERRAGVIYASPLQTYLDLQHGSGRAKDLAEHLRREKLEA